MVTVAVVGNDAAPVSETVANEGVTPHSSSNVSEERLALSHLLQMMP